MHFEQMDQAETLILKSANLQYQYLYFIGICVFPMADDEVSESSRHDDRKQI